MELFLIKRKLKQLFAHQKRVAQLRFQAQLHLLEVMHLEVVLTLHQSPLMKVLPRLEHTLFKIAQLYGH